MKMKTAKIFGILVSVLVLFVSCSRLMNEGESRVSINLPHVSGGNSRAISSDEIQRVKNDHAGYRIHINDRVLEGTGGNFSSYFPIGVKVDVFIECVNGKGEVILRTVTKSIVVATGENVMYFNLKEDGEIVNTEEPGELKSMPSPGDIIMNDGTLKKVTSSLIDKTNAIAIVYKVDTTTKTAWAVGKVLNPCLKWAENTVAGYSAEIAGLKTGVSDRTFTGYKDGSTGLGILQAAVGDANPLTETNYVAWNWVYNYAQYSGMVSPTNFGTGWYLPSVAELYDIYDRKDMLNEALVVASELDELMVTKFYDQRWWTSSTPDSASGPYTNALAIDFSDGQTVPEDKKSEDDGGGNDYGVCAVRQFTY